MAGAWMIVKPHTCPSMPSDRPSLAGVQIRNTGGVGGNIVTSSPISDMNPLYMAARAVFVVGGQGTPEREVRPFDCVHAFKAMT